MLTKKQKQSEAAKKAWRSRKRMIEARGMRRVPTGVERVKLATTPYRTSTEIAKELGVSSAYVRKCWAELGHKKRPGGRPAKGSIQSAETLNA